MFDNTLQKNISNNSPIQEKGVYNQFVSPLVPNKPKKDSVRLVLVTMLVVVILLTAGAFFYTKVLAAKINESKNKLADYDSTLSVMQFEKNLPEMKNLSQRLKLLNTVYDSKEYISAMFFPILESLVESSPTSYVYFNNLSLKKRGDSNLVKVSLTGVALDYPTLYRQVNNFKFGKYVGYIHDFKLDSFSQDENRNINFTISFDMDINTTAFLKFLESLKSGDETASSTGTVESGPLHNRNIRPVVDQNSASSTDTSNASSSVIDFSAGGGSSGGLNDTIN